MGEVLRIINWGAQIPKWSVTTWIRSSVSLLLHVYYSIDITDGGFCVESPAGVFCVESVGNVFWALAPACHYQITFHRPKLAGRWEYLLFNPFMCVQFTLCVWVWKKATGVSKSREVPIPWVLPCLRGWQFLKFSKSANKYRRQ